MKVALIGNYGPDRQESMLRYAALVARGLDAVGAVWCLSFRGRS